MPRYHVHITVTDDLWSACDPVVTVTLDAIDDQMAELNARALLASGLFYDVCEIEREDGEPCNHEESDPITATADLA